MLLRTYHYAGKHLAIPLIRKTLSTRYFSINVAVVGSGPAGFYTAQKLLKNLNVKVDIFEKLPVPFGLVRYGVAPDHAEIKNVINSFTTVANSDRVSFYGNISLGQNIALDDLIEAYHVVVLCYGSAQDKLLDIDGEKTTKNTISARNFVGWYNGVPEDKDLNINLDCDTACIVGHGNVALDCARILLKPANLEKTDITTYAQQRIAKSQIKKIYLIGRRGPVQVSFTTKELRELIKMNENMIRLEPADIFESINLSAMQALSRQRRRLTELIVSIASTREKNLTTSVGVECVLKFLSKPIKIVGDEKTRHVRRLDLQKMSYNLDSFNDENAKPEELNEFESIDCGLIIRSIGYKAVMVDKSLPMNNRAGSIMNTKGRVHGHRSLYCSGWLATGATGVIAGTLNSSSVTAQSILEDIQSREIPNLTRVKPGFEMIGRILSKKSVQVVHFTDWLKIDELERRLGETLGKTREKFVDVDKMLEVASKKSLE